MTPPPDAQSILTIDCRALAANWRLLAARAAPAVCAAVVKADAYGTGIAVAVPALVQAGCRTFFTAHASEGIRARTALRGIGLQDRDARVFVLNGLPAEAGALEAYRAFALGAVLGSADQMAAWTAARGQAGTDGFAASAVHVDTGMNRMGFSPADAAGLDAAAIEASGAALLMSHFVGAEEPGSAVTAAQIARFEALRRGPLGALPASLANSYGLFLPSRPFFQLVRPGYALYGGNPTPGEPNPMRPVVRLEARILEVRSIAPGETAGYNGRWTAVRPSRLATIGLGYADGLPRNAHSLGPDRDGPVGLAGQHPCPFVGRVSMDLSILDVTDAPPCARRPGDLVEVLGATISVEDLGRQCGTIGYEILTSLGRRATRRTIDA